MTTFENACGPRILRRTVVTFTVGLSLALPVPALGLTRLNPIGHFGGEVNATADANDCFIPEICQPATTGAAAGWFHTPTSVAIDQSSHNIYVTDSNNQRVQEFEPSGAFLRAWGPGVVSGAFEGTGVIAAGSLSVTHVKTTRGGFVRGQTITGAGIRPGTSIKFVNSGEAFELSGPATTSGTVALTVIEGAGNVPTDEQQTLTIKATSGEFRLAWISPAITLDETKNLPYNASATNVQEALEEKLGSGNVSVSGGGGDQTGSKPYVITFQGVYGDTTVNEVEAVSVGLAGGSPSSGATLAVSRVGASAFEVCTAASVCQEGVFVPTRLAGSGTMSFPESVAVDNTCFEEKWTGATCTTNDPSNGDAYVQDSRNHRIQKFDSTGKFVLMIGGDVNKTKVELGTGATQIEKDVCTATSGDVCQSGEARAYPNNKEGFFQEWQTGMGGMLAVGGPNHLLYVTDEGRVQKFDASGVWQGELPLSHATNKATALSVDKAGDVYVSESYACSCNEPPAEAPSGVREYEFTAGKYVEKTAFDASSHFVEAIALDPNGRMTVTEGPSPLLQGVLFGLLGEPIPFGSEGSTSLAGSSLSYDATTDRLYTPGSGAAKPGSRRQEVNVFELSLVPSVRTKTAAEVTSRGATLTGEVDPESTSPDLRSTSKFEYGRCLPAPRTCSESPYEHVVTSTPSEVSGLSFAEVKAHLASLVPNQRYHYRLIAQNKNGTNSGEEEQLLTLPLKPAITSAPGVSFLTSDSAVFAGALNPENATTKYEFQYALASGCEEREQEVERPVVVSECLEVVHTPIQSSAVYAEIGAMQEVVGLLPATHYRFELFAENEYKEVDTSESEFITAPPVRPEAITGDHSVPTATSAVIAGEVNPDGQPAIYLFELGVYDGASTQFGIVLAAPAGEAAGRVVKELQLAGLQPGKTYAYRISIESGYGVARGAMATFTTAGLPEVLFPFAAPPQLTVPNFAFPTEGKGKPLTRAQHLARALKVCRKKSRRQRASCERNARKKYGGTPKGKKK